MKHTPSPPCESSPPTLEYCYDWLTPEDAIKHALAAFYAACRYHDHAARAFPDDGFSTREKWAETFTEILRLRVDLQAKDAGVLIHEKTHDYLTGYIEPIWHCDILPNRDTNDDIHCRSFLESSSAD